MNILIKLMSIVSLVIAPTLANLSGTKPHVATTEQKAPVVNSKTVAVAKTTTNNTVANF